MELRDYCWTIEKFSFLRLYYAIIDCDEYLADNLFIKHQVTVRFGPEFACPDHHYRVIFCSIRKRDEQVFLEAMAELPNKMLLCGYPDYPAFCTELRRSMDKAKEERIYHEADRSPEEAKQACAEGIS